MTALARILIGSALVCGAPAIADQSPIGVPIQAPGPTGYLGGILLAAGSGRAPVVLIIPGSGPTDHDGNSPRGLNAAPYRLLAEGLAARAITTVRIDKRGMFTSAAATTDANAVTIPDYVSDVQAWIATIRARTGASCVWLLGHSEGGLVAMAAAQNQSDVCGLVLVATAGRPMGEVLREQLRRKISNAPVLNEAMAAIDSLEAGKRVDTSSMHPRLMPLFNPQVQGFLVSAFAYDPAHLLAGYRKPVLILQGQRDVQVSEADANLLQGAAPRAVLVLLPNTNHVLKSVGSDDLRANMATYSDPNLPLAPGVVGAIADFLAAVH